MLSVIFAPTGSLVRLPALTNRLGAWGASTARRKGQSSVARSRRRRTNKGLDLIGSESTYRRGRVKG
jgi:hypothetical protein